MPSLRISSMMILAAFASQGLGFAQIKDRDFTRRSGSEFKRFIGGSKNFRGKTIPRITTKRIHVSEIPFHYSRFGGKRFPSNRVNILQRREFPVPMLKFPTTFGSVRAGVSDKRVIDDLSKVSRTTVPSQEFRNKYHESLDKRVEQWMKKVNNLSMADVNRYQFRRGRSTKPGFPIHQAGAQSPPVPAAKPLSSSSSKDFRASPATKSKSPSRYWLGPSKTKTSGSVLQSAPRMVTPSTRNVPQARPSTSVPRYAVPRSKDRSKYPTIRFGPPKISARAK